MPVATGVPIADPAERRRILVCEAPTSGLATLRAVLRRVGHQVETETDAGAVPARLAAEPADLLVVEIGRSASGGLALIRWVRERWSERQLPIVATVEPGASRLRLLALQAGAQEVVDRSCEPAELGLRFSRLLAARSGELVRQTLESRFAARADRLDALLDTVTRIGAERDRDRLLHRILFDGQRLLNCDGGSLYLATDRQTLRFARRTRDDTLPSFEIPLQDTAGRPNLAYVSTWVAHHKVPVLIDDVYRETRFDLAGTRRFDAETGYRTVSMLTVPLVPRDGEVIGVLQYMNAKDPATGEIVPFHPELVALVEAFAAQAAVALDNVELVESHRALMENMIRMLASAIDAKSPYTGAHCEKVPELALALARAACDCTEGTVAAFRFETEAEWQEFRIGAWLHDVGKVTTPEYVIDKATKLETLCNRIHEVRTRFEVLHRDAEIDRLRALLAGADPATAAAAHAERLAALQDDYAFVAGCNVGGETLADAHVERLERIAADRTWLRHFDDRLGLSEEERHARGDTPVEALPVVEPLLADKPHHVVPRPAGAVPDPRHGFRMPAPEHLYDRGELHNLKVRRGTLTEEERHKIKEHMVQTVVMLEGMSFPKSLRRVPEYAGTHHETLIGSGYPRALGAAELSVPARIMAIADVFEALTACDRPYKSPKKLSEALGILRAMGLRRHLDAELFNLFLRSGIWLDYGRRHLRPEQLDAVDVPALTIDVSALEPLPPPPSGPVR